MDFLVWFGGGSPIYQFIANALFFQRCFGDGKCLPNMVSVTYGLQ